MRRFQSTAKGYLNINVARYSFSPFARRLTLLCWAGLLSVGCANLIQPGLDSTASAMPPDQSAAQSSPLPSAPAPDILVPDSSSLASSDDSVLDPTDGTDLWQRLRAGMALDYRTDEKRVKQEIRWLQRHPEYWNRLAPRMQRYLPYILEEVEARDLPTELALLPVIESALDPYAFSSYGASGLWQFMQPTAKQYGLTITRGYDARRDVVASTAAALDFLQDLHRRFDDWPLALAAYNAGGGRVASALRKSRSEDFFKLRLPRETRSYVPRLLAVAAIVADPAQYGVDLPAIDNLDPLIVLELPGAFDVGVVAQLLALESTQIYEFNPALKRPRWSTEESLQLILPRNWEGQGDNLPDARDAVTAALARLNELPEDQRVAWRTVIVQSGDTVSEIAQANGLSSRALRTLNNLRSDVLQIGQRLQVPASAGNSRPATPGTFRYTVRPGDSLWRIAKQQDTTVSKLVALNKIGPNELLRVGQVLTVPSANGAVVYADAPPNKIRKIQYRVRRGDSLSRIAQRFKISVGDIVRWNDLQPKRYLQPGQGLTLYVDVIGG